MKPRLRAGLLAAALVLPLVGCQAPAPGTGASAAGTPAQPAAASTPAYPRTVTLDDRSTTVTKKVEKIVALSPDVADVVMALTGSDRLVAVPELTKRAEHSVNAAAAQKVATGLDSNAGKDPEKILALSPDLVMLTTRHEAESDALKQLSGAGVPVFAVTNDWDTPEAWAKNVTAIAQLLGEEEKGKQLIADHQARWGKVRDAVAAAPDKPVTAIIRILGPNTWINGPGTIGHTILNQAGTTNAADVLGIKAGTKLDNETLLKANPAWIVVVDSAGKGREQYAKVLADPALASVDAVKNDRIVVVTSGELASGTGGIVAYEKIARAVHPDLVK